MELFTTALLDDTKNYAIAQVKRPPDLFMHWTGLTAVLSVSHGDQHGRTKIERKKWMNGNRWALMLDAAIFFLAASIAG